jgi:hypothetical protein
VYLFSGLEIFDTLDSGCSGDGSSGRYEGARGWSRATEGKIVGLSFESFSQLAEIAADANSLNVASLKVMEKLGMRRVGVSQQQRSGHEGLVDVVTCSLSRAAWLASEAQSAEE